MIGGAVMTPNEMRSSLLLSLAFVAALAGCTPDPKPGGPARVDGPAENAAENNAQKKKALQRSYDAQGRLLPSDEYIVGIRLPRGAELFREDVLLHVYRIRAPINKVLAYFGPMMITGNVERRGKGAIYKGASVRGAEVNPTKVDVAILEVGSSVTRISVREIPPPTQHAPSPDHTRAAARQSFRRLD